MKEKVEAIFDLREAAERHGRAQAALEQEATVALKDALLDARVDLEEKTREAMEACEYCGLPHAQSGQCSNVVLFPGRRDPSSGDPAEP